jgi:hypothetical protein
MPSKRSSVLPSQVGGGGGGGVGRGKGREAVLHVLLREGARHAYDAARRTLWLRHVPAAAAALGLAAAKYTQALLPLLLGWLMGAPDDDSRLLAADALRRVLAACWPRVPHHADTLWAAVRGAWVDAAGRENETELKSSLTLLCEVGSHAFWRPRDALFGGM